MTETFDAIVVGSGITGGYAAMELTRKGLKVLMIERGRKIDHISGYKTEHTPPWELPFRGYGDAALWARDYPIQSTGRYFDEWTYRHFVSDAEHPYQTTEDQPFRWRRSYQLGGRSLVWGRQAFRLAEIDFEANARDGHGIDWPIRYRDIAPWYDRVEEFIGVQGENMGCSTLPDGKFQPPFPMMPVELAFKEKLARTYPDRFFSVSRSAHLTVAKDGRSPCQNRFICARGCSFGAYFSTQSSTLPAAQATGNLTLLTDTLVQSLEQDARTGKISGVRVMNTQTKEKTTYSAKIVFLCASTFNSLAILMRSANAKNPRGLANSSGLLGQYIMEHVGGGVGAAASVPGFEQTTVVGNRPTGIILPRFQNLTEQKSDFLRGYVYFGGASQAPWRSYEGQAGLGEDLKAKIRKPGPWRMALSAHGEMLPNKLNRMTLDHKRRDSEGSPQIRIEFKNRENELKMMADAENEARKMLLLLGGSILSSSSKPGTGGATAHEMGGACMGRNPKSSVLNAWNQPHDIPNLFVTDGACMSSTGSVNPSLTYMALTARAADASVSMLKEGAI